MVVVRFAITSPGVSSTVRVGTAATAMVLDPIDAPREVAEIVQEPGRSGVQGR
jgi:hypothetical protein